MRGAKIRAPHPLCRNAKDWADKNERVAGEPQTAKLIQKESTY